MVEVGADDVCALGHDVGHDLFFVIGLGFALLDMDGAQRAGADAGAQAVAEEVGDQAGLAVDELQGAFGAIGQALAAAVADLVVNADDLSFHVNSPFGFVMSVSSERQSFSPARSRSKP